MIDRAKPIALLLARVAIGAIFFIHGWMKLTEAGLAATTGGFEQMGIPLATLAAPAVTFLEIIGGIAIIIGAALPVAGTLLAIDMVGAIYFVHLGQGFSVERGGYEFVLALGAAALAVGFSGGGVLAVDTLLERRRTPETAGV
ncbi:hypothetical protein C1I98_26300 [Spongiactinospora gelatinilytica]|uniref:DoxX family protein n=1 Tax=Spongiactinospora gelatinilytica TaxID=2666298 RepID=A0A2W2HCL1_9ACTN|nr:DoxX family protein [Spongiactinospora gelatinilytica]PZG36804.1 hypothetical protein C1I98_26300 [Spongiactinospora gelatinilytica]